MSALEISFVAIILVLIFLIRIVRRNAVKLEREKYIRRYVFSSTLFEKVKHKYPNLQEKDAYLVARALRQFFIIYLNSGNKTVGMPSKVVDEMWHEFILDTRKYTAFCKKAFGSYFHHVPASASFRGVAVANSVKLTMRLACLEENINPDHPTRLPLLFAIDEKLDIADGNKYKLPAEMADKKSSDTDSRCDSSGCGGIACGGDSCGDSASGCCGSSGCSGGCGGGD